jgi:hypothetical protein
MKFLKRLPALSVDNLCELQTAILEEIQRRTALAGHTTASDQPVVRVHRASEETAPAVPPSRKPRRAA